MDGAIVECVIDIVCPDLFGSCEQQVSVIDVWACNNPIAQAFEPCSASIEMDGGKGRRSGRNDANGIARPQPVRFDAAHGM